MKRKHPARFVLPRSWYDSLSLFRRRTYLEDGLMTLHLADFCQDRRFMSAYEKGRGTGSWNGSELRWRVYTACWAAERARGLAGDFVECGVNRGGMSLTIMEYIGFNTMNKRFFLLDTYRGFPESLLAVAARANLGHFQECYDDVVKTFAPFPNVQLIRGSVPETLNQVDASEVCYLSLDMNCMEPEIAALRHFWPKLVAGAVVLLDDYSYSESYRRQKEAFDALARELNFNVLCLPTGQGLIVKP
jgi:O-methyltransferase